MGLTVYQEGHRRTGRLDVQMSATDAGGAVRIDGELDMQTGLQLCETLAAERPSFCGLSTVGLDLSGTSFVDCAGLAALLYASGEILAPWKVTITGASSCLRRLIQLVHLEPLLGLPMLRLGVTDADGGLPS